MKTVIEQIEKLEERFFDAEEETGHPVFDGEAIETDLPEDEYDEVAMMVEVIKNSTLNAMMSIEMLMRRGHKDKLSAMFGEESPSVLEDAYLCMEGVLDLFEIASPKVSAPEMPESEPEEEIEAEQEPEAQEAEEPKEDPAQDA